MTEHDISVLPNGNLRFIWNDEFADLAAQGLVDIKRVSHVEPTEDGQWTADMKPASGPILGPFRLRSQALAAEVTWLKEMGF